MNFSGRVAENFMAKLTNKHRGSSHTHTHIVQNATTLIALLSSQLYLRWSSILYSLFLSKEIIFFIRVGNHFITTGLAARQRTNRTTSHSDIIRQIVFFFPGRVLSLIFSAFCRLQNERTANTELPRNLLKRSGRSLCHPYVWFNFIIILLCLLSYSDLELIRNSPSSCVNGSKPDEKSEYQIENLCLGFYWAKLILAACADFNWGLFLMALMEVDVERFELKEMQTVQTEGILRGVL